MIRKLLLGLMIASVASLAWGHLPDAGNSEVWVGEYPGFADCGAMFVPDNSGTLLENAFRTGAGQGHDCRIWVKVLDVNENPIAGIHWTDMWLEWGGTLTLCDSANDNPFLAQTNAEGENYWNGTRAAGGYGASHTVIVLSTELTAQAQINVNSPDIDANGVVNVLDTIEYQALVGTASYIGDFDFSGTVNVLDTIIYQASVGKACP